jgi:putative transposase
LFESPFRRKLISSENHFTWLVWYIHANAQRHGLISDFKSWKHSSYHSLISDKPTLLNREEVMNWFGSREDFISFHNWAKDDIDEMVIE